MATTASCAEGPEIRRVHLAEVNAVAGLHQGVSRSRTWGAVLARQEAFDVLEDKCERTFLGDDASETGDERVAFIPCPTQSG
jgi:hypothetical protein